MAHDERDERGRGWGRPTEWSGDPDAFGEGWGNQTPHPERLGDRNRRRLSDDPDAGMPRYGSAPEAGYGAGYGANTDPDPFYSAAGYDPEFGGPRFDRADVGSTGTHGVHPVSSPFGSGYRGIGEGGSGFGSSARAHAMMTDAQFGHRRDRGERRHDPHYEEWRRRQIEELDRDYDEYCREHQSRFEREFGDWREERSRKRQLLERVGEHMEVVGSDGAHVGTVDAVRGDHIVLTRSDPESGGVHRAIPCSWIDEVGDKVRLNLDAEEAMRRWQEEESKRALFERPGQGQDGPHVLNRSFSGTYRRD